MAPPSFGKKVAVVLIHGMGEQHPMDTLRGFVRSVWHPASQLFASDAQRELFRVLSSGVDGWRVSDLITLGSSLTHADVLLAESGDELKNKIDARELLRSPPIKEGDPPSFTYAPRSGNGKRFLHHAAVMAATR